MREWARGPVSASASRVSRARCLCLAGVSESGSVPRAVPWGQSWAFVGVNHRYVDHTHTAHLFPHAAQRGCLKHDVLNPKANDCRESTCSYCPLLRDPFPKSGDSARDASQRSDKPSPACDAAIISPTGLRSGAPQRHQHRGSFRDGGTPLGPLRGRGSGRGSF